MPFTKFEFCRDMFDKLTEKLDKEYQEVSDSWENQDDISNWLEEFFVYNGNNDNSIYYLSDYKTYLNKMMTEYDDIISWLNDEDMLDDVKASEMTKNLIFKKVLYLVCKETCDIYANGIAADFDKFEDE